MDVKHIAGFGMEMEGLNPKISAFGLSSIFILGLGIIMSTYMTCDFRTPSWQGVIYPWTPVGVAAIGIMFTLFTLWLKRRRTKLMLEGRGLPTVHWRPRFINYRPFEEEQKMASSTITRILPRMKRLGGPYGMYGTVYGISTPVIHVAHPVPAKAIFGTSMRSTSSSSDSRRRRSSIAGLSGASKAPAYNHFKNFCGEGVFTADGEDWKAKRASLIHCLIRGTNSSTSEVSKRLEQEANRAAADFCKQIESFQKSCKGPVVANVVPVLQRSTVGLIYRYITHDEPDWGIRPHESTDNRSVNSCDASDTSSLSSVEASVESGEHNHDDDTPPINPTPKTSGLLDPYLDAIIRIRMIVLAQSRSIWFVLPNWCYRFFSPMYKDEEETLGPIRNFAREACNRAKEGSPLAKLKEMESHNRGPKVNGFSKDILDEAITLLFAGQDTSAATLSWTLHLLSIYPDVQKKVADEVCKVMEQEGLASSDPFMTRKTISQMPYLDAVVKESMRLYPVAPFVARRLVHDIAVNDDSGGSGGKSTILPAGSVACIWIHGLHHNPAMWNRADDFLPERWIDPDLKDSGQINGAYMPFAAGPRNCVGQPLAQIVLRTLLAKLVQRYEFCDDSLAAGDDPKIKRKDMQAGFTVLPSGGVTLSMRERRYT
jgi:hypothetical protein